MILKLIAQSLISFVAVGLFVFVPAGTLAWPQAWVFLAIYIVGSAAIGLWLRANDPALLAERAKSPLGADQRPRDRAVMAAIVVLFCAWFVVMGVEARRFGWSHVPVWLEAIGASLLIGGFFGWATVLRVNTFAATTIRLQTERRQTVVSSGPYGLVRHPMYSYALLVIAGTALLLGSYLGLGATALFALLLAARALGEEEILIAHLPGYRDYAARVRYRLVPGLW